MDRFPYVLAFFLFAWTPLSFAQKVQWLSHARLGLGENHENLELPAGNGEPGVTAVTGPTSRERSFYAAEVGTLVTRETIQSQWTQSLDFESGQAWKEDAHFRQVSSSGNYEVRDLKNRYRLGLSLTHNQGDLNYKRPPLTQVTLEDGTSSSESLYYGLQAGYSRSLDAFTSLGLEIQSSVYRQESTDVRTHRLSASYQEFIKPSWDMSLVWNGNWQENREASTSVSVIELAWVNNLRPSFQDFLTQAIGVIRTLPTDGLEPRNNYSLTLGYTHLFQNNKLIEANPLKPKPEPTGSGQESNGGPVSSQPSTPTLPQDLLGNIQDATHSNLISLFWLRSLSSLETGSEQFVTEQVGLNYNYTQAQGHQFEASVSQSSQFDPERRTRIQRQDQNLRLAFLELIQYSANLRPELFDRVGLEYLRQIALEKNQDLRASRWTAAVTYEARF